MSISDRLQELIDCKSDIKTAIEEKGVSVTGGLSSYADAVREISGGVSLLPGTKFAYSDCSEFPWYDTSGMTDFHLMFAHSKVIKIPGYNTSNATTMREMVLACMELKEIPLLDCSNVKRFEMFGQYSYPVLDIPTLGGFRNLGQSITDDRNIAAASYYNVSFDRCFTTPQSMVNVFNELYDLEENGRDMLTIQLNSSTKQNMTDEQIAIATRKGWRVVV